MEGPGFGEEEEPMNTVISKVRGFDSKISDCLFYSMTLIECVSLNGPPLA
jgi:hypothetical protein